MEGRAVRKPGDNNDKTSKDNNTTTHRAKATGAANGIPAGDLAPVSVRDTCKAGSCVTQKAHMHGHDNIKHY